MGTAVPYKRGSWDIRGGGGGGASGPGKSLQGGWLNISLFVAERQWYSVDVSDIFYFSAGGEEGGVRGARGGGGFSSGLKIIGGGGVSAEIPTQRTSGH